MTAVSPAFGAAAIMAYLVHNSPIWGFSFLIIGVLCALISYLVIQFIGQYVPNEPLKIIDLEMPDQKVLEFLIAYLLPVFPSANLTNMLGSLVLTAYSLLI